MEIKMSRKLNSKKGFTLVELAIVLVIIGLIVSGVLVGQDLIKAAELRATVKQAQTFQVAVNTFVGKYSGLPGDVQGNKYSLTGGCNAGTAGLGDGNGRIESSGGGNATYDGEISCFWSNLTTNGKELIQGAFNGNDGAAAGNDVVGDNMPQMKFGSNGWGVYFSGNSNFFVTGVLGNQTDDSFDTAEPFVPIDAFNIDSKIDDGSPSTGDVIAINGQTAGTPALITGADFTNAGVSATTCQNTTPTPNEYQFTATQKLCNLSIRMQTF